MNEADDRALTNLRKGVLEYCLLALLKESDMYGWQMAHRLGDQGMAASEGTIYPLLARLQRLNHVTSYLAQSDSGRSRRYYTLTDSGQAHLDNFSLLWNDFAATVTTFITPPERRP